MVKIVGIVNGKGCRCLENVFEVCSVKVVGNYLVFFFFMGKNIVKGIFIVIVFRL